MNIPNFSRDQKALIVACIQKGATVAQLRDGMLRMLQLDTDDKSIKAVSRTLYKRIQKIKQRMPKDTYENERQQGEVVLQTIPHWRILEFSQLLQEENDTAVRARLLRDIRKEQEIIDGRKTPQKQSAEASHLTHIDTYKTEPGEPPLDVNDEDDPRHNPYSLYDYQRIPDEIKQVTHFHPKHWDGYGMTGGPYPSCCLYLSWLSKTEYKLVEYKVTGKLYTDTKKKVVRISDNKDVCRHCGIPDCNSEEECEKRVQQLKAAYMKDYREKYG